MEIKDGFFYFFKNTFLQKHKDSTLMSTHKSTGRRPFYCISDPERPDIKWMIPLSTNVEKWSKKIQYKREHNLDHSLIVINRIPDFKNKSVFLIQNAVPCLESDIDELFTITFLISALLNIVPTTIPISYPLPVYCTVPL